MLLIDGYNLCFARSSLTERRDSLWLERTRTRMLGALQRYQQKTRKQITVVFDARTGTRWGQEKLDSGVRTVFAPSAQDADIVIRKRVQNSTDPRSITVVSSDAEVVRSVRSCGAKTLSAEDFLRQLDGLERKMESEDSPKRRSAKLEGISPEEARGWAKLFGVEDEL